MGLFSIFCRAAPEDDHYKNTPAERPLFDFSYDGVMRSVEESLVRLGLDRVDVLLVHDPDNHYPTRIKIKISVVH